jgi:hypothetical protein
MAHQADNSAIDPRLLKWMEDRNRFAEQNEDGVDLSLMTPDERIRQNYEHARQTIWIHRNARRIRS